MWAHVGTCLLLRQLARAFLSTPLFLHPELCAAASASSADEKLGGGRMCTSGCGGAESKVAACPWAEPASQLGFAAPASGLLSIPQPPCSKLAKVCLHCIMLLVALTIPNTPQALLAPEITHCLWSCTENSGFQKH